MEAACRVGKDSAGAPRATAEACPPFQLAGADKWWARRDRRTFAHSTKSPVRANQQKAVYPLCKKYFAFSVGQISSTSSPRPFPARGADRASSRTRDGMRWTRQRRRVPDKRVLKLIRAFLNAGVLEDGLVRPVDEGTPQGGPLSPFLSNIVLDDLDKELTRRGHRFCHYADDCNIYVRSLHAGERVSASMRRPRRVKIELLLTSMVMGPAFVGTTGGWCRGATPPALRDWRARCCGWPANPMPVRRPRVLGSDV
jgi:hypothetical protein